MRHSYLAYSSDTEKQLGIVINPSSVDERNSDGIGIHPSSIDEGLIPMPLLFLCITTACKIACIKV